MKKKEQSKKSRRLDNNRIALRKGESQRANGTYYYRYTTRDGKTHSVYAKTLEELREKETLLVVDRYDGVRTDGNMLTVNDIFD